MYLDHSVTYVPRLYQRPSNGQLELAALPSYRGIAVERVARTMFRQPPLRVANRRRSSTAIALDGREKHRVSSARGFQAQD